jgi:tRNA-guanine family transglycosylase
MHNIRFLLRLMDRVREAIAKNDYENFAKEFLRKYY